MKHHLQSLFNADHSKSVCSIKMHENDAGCGGAMFDFGRKRSEKVGKGQKRYSKLTEPKNLYILKCQFICSYQLSLYFNQSSSF